MSDLSIKFYDRNFKPSEYQLKIFDEVSNGVNNIIIQACSGAGKTSTIVNIIDLLGEKKKILFIAFNKAIVGELKQRIGDVDNIDIMTYHSLGYSILRENYRYAIQDVNEYKYKSYITTNIKNLTTNTADTFDNKYKYNFYIENISSLVDFARYNLCQTHEEIENIAKKYGIGIMRDEIDVVLKVLAWGRESIGSIDYTDMIWIPNEENLHTKRHLYDWILIDESQDTSIMQREMFMKCFKRGTRFISVGDDYQSINQWCGASDEAMASLAKLPHTKIFYLPITYRCPKKIVELAKEYSPNIIPKPDAIDGKITYDAGVNEPKSGDMVLCRTTAPLVRLHMHYLKINKKSFIKGRDVGSNMISLIEKTGETYIKERNGSLGLINRLYVMLFSIKNNLVNELGLSEANAYKTSQVIDLYDSIKAIETLSEGVETVEELKNKISSIFIDSDGNGVCLSTVHKAKGLEADNVFILCKSLMPSPLAKMEWQITTERNLIYVAITRAKKTLSFISEKEFPPLSLVGNDAQLNELSKIENKIMCQLPITPLKTKTKQEEHTKKPKKIKQPITEDVSPTLQALRAKKGVKKFGKFIGNSH